MERWSWAPNREDRFAVEFRWRWKPLNAVGERVTMNAPYSFSPERPGRAWYQRDGEGWRLDEMWLSNDDRDYMSRVTH